ncbi:hypothetical protein [Sphingomonas sp.]|uniref:hypothetical protein n=1 Tax=Sphingomonas sp. TaxID=28214 RepID=UPI0025811E10|nr:hypothetical protein [Sphingomonas sp.]
MTQTTPSSVDAMREALEATAGAPHKRYPGQITDHIYSSDCPACVAQILLRHWPHTLSTLPSDGVTIPAIPAGMKPWDGGDTAPEDWDGGPVLVRNGDLIRRPERGELNLWRHYAGWPLGDVIAYSPKPPMVANNGVRRCETCGERLDNDQRIPCHDCTAAPKAPPVAQAEGVERAIAQLRQWESDTPIYAGDDPRANHYRQKRETIRLAIAALSATTEQGEGE